MLEIAIPGRDPLHIEHLLLDVNGTLTIDGKLIPGLAPRIAKLKEALSVTLLTADTFGTARRIAEVLDVDVGVLGEGQGGDEKRQLVRRLGGANVIAIGNGANDAMMLQAAGLGIAVMQEEGAAGATLYAADIVFGSICDALDAVLHPLRLTATLRA